MPHARPLSPHLGIYKWQITMLLSVLHRLTGLFLCLGALLITWGLIALASSDSAWSAFAAFCGSWIGIVLLFLWTFSLFFHLCNGIRHLFWDVGVGFDAQQRSVAQTPAYMAPSWVIVATSVALTLAIWIWLIIQSRGGAA